MTKEELHALCKALELPRSGNRQTLLIRVAGVLSAQHKNWGTIKRSLKRGGGSVEIPMPEDSDEEQTSQSQSIEKKVETFVSDHPEGWTFEEESELIETMEEEGLDTSLSDVASSIEESLTSHVMDVEQPVPPMLQELSSEEPTLEEEAALLEISSRRAEVEAAA